MPLQEKPMETFKKLLILSVDTLGFSLWSASNFAAETLVEKTLATKASAANVVALSPVMSPSGGILKMVLGLVVVLAVMALITWFLKRMLPGVGAKQSVVRIVGGVSVGSRERIVVVEVAGRWLVVGVAAGQVNGIANLEIGAEQLALSAASEANSVGHAFTNSTEPFAQWLNKSVAKILDKKNVSQ